MEMIRKLLLGALVLLGSAVFGRGAEAADLRKVSIQIDGAAVPYYALTRSEERRVGKECRSRWSPYH